MNLIEFRARNQLTQQQFAESIGVRQQTIAKYETSKSKPSLDVINRISSVYEITIQEVWEMFRLNELIKSDNVDAFDEKL